MGDVFWINTDETPDNGVDDDLNGYVDDVSGWNFYNNNNVLYNGAEDSHGTHCAGTIAAASDNGLGIAGLVSDGSARLMVLKVLGGENSMGTTSSVIEAIEYAEKNGASIVNLSFATSRYDRALYQSIENSSMLFVVAAGNDGSCIDDGGAYPACYALNNIISVAALSYDGLLYRNSNYRCRFS
jgi:subtilisin family serine protease